MTSGPSFSLKPANRCCTVSAPPRSCSRQPKHDAAQEHRIQERHGELSEQRNERKHHHDRDVNDRDQNPRGGRSSEEPPCGAPPVDTTSGRHRPAFGRRRRRAGSLQGTTGRTWRVYPSWRIGSRQHEDYAARTTISRTSPPRNCGTLGDDRRGERRFSRRLFPSGSTHAVGVRAQAAHRSANARRDVAFPGRGRTRKK